MYDSLADDARLIRMAALVWDTRTRLWRRAQHRCLMVRLAAILVTGAQLGRGE
jgi:hypothetical protein